MITTNRYDNLMAKAKTYRNKIEKRTINTDVRIKELQTQIVKINTNADVKIKELQTQIAKIKYQKDTYVSLINNKLTDVTSLIENERKRILKDAKEQRGE